MRVVIALLFAVAATVGLFSIPYWPQRADVQKFAAGDELTLAKRFVQDVRTRQFGDASAIMEPAYRPRDNAVLEKISTLFPARKEDSFFVTAWHKFVMAGTENTEIEMFYDFGKDGAIRGQFVTHRDSNGLSVRRAHFDTFAASALHQGDFRLPGGIRDARWLFLGVAALFDIFAIATFVLCLLSPVVRWRWRWLWLLFVLAGAIRFNLDWTTLQSEFLFGTLLAPPAGFYRFTAFGPWVLSIGAPIGALIYWAKRTQWRAEEAGVRDLRAA
jgi:hypothetical protein